MPSPAALAKARRRRRRAALGTSAVTLTIGSLLYLLAAFEMFSIRHDPGLSLLDRINLAITPSDGIGIVAALVAVVLSITLTLAVLAPPDDPVERVLNTDWQLAMALVSLLSSSLSVMTVLMCWFSSQRSHSWGTLLGATA